MADMAACIGLNCQQKDLGNSLFVNTTQYECSLSVLVHVCVSVYLLLRDLPGISMWRMFSVSALNTARSTTVSTNKPLD